MIGNVFGLSCVFFFPKWKGGHEGRGRQVDSQIAS